MKFKMTPNSVFAILLRNPWWISFLVAAVVSAVCAALLPRELVAFGALGTIPFLVVGCIALKRQWNAPSAAALQAELARLNALPWRDFSKELVAKFETQGYTVKRFEGKSSEAADFLLNKQGQTTLVAAKRYKAASHGTEPLQALVAQQGAQNADAAMYICLGSLSEQAQLYAQQHNITVTTGF
jgi:restriction system protein